MPLTAIANGQATDASQLNQLINLLTGVLNDQPVTLKADNTRAGSQLNLDTVNAAQQAAAIFKDAGTTKWQLGKNTDNSFFLYDFVRAANALTFVQNGALTITPAVTITGLLTATLATAAQPNVTSLGTLTGLTVGGTSNFADSSFIMSATGTAYSSATFQARSNQGSTVPVRLAFHMSGIVAAQIGMDSTGLIRTYDNPGTGYAPFAALSATLSGTGTGVNSPLAFTQANPSIYASSYISFPGGIYINGGTLYAQNQANFRGGIINDTGVDLNLGGAAGGNVRAFTKYRMRVKNNANTVVGTTWTKINLALIDYDPNSNFNTTTSTYTVPSAGYYLIIGKFTTYSIPAGIWFESAIFKNGVELDRDSQSSGSITSDNANVVGIYLLAANDTITLNAAVSSGTVSSWSPDGSSFCSLTVHFLSAP